MKIMFIKILLPVQPKMSHSFSLLTVVTVISSNKDDNGR
jgi:hypothetical protein